jgi:dihydroxyacid dehydratase/phosphogluconate dehydratase
VRRHRLRALLKRRDGVDPEDVIASPEAAKRQGMTSTICFPHGNLAPEGSVIKSTSIDPSVVDDDGVFRMTGPAKVFVTEADAIAAIKEKRIDAGDVLVLMGRGPMGSGMEETYQLTGALKYLPHGKHVAVVTDARFSGVSTGACIGHISPEALAGGPLGKLRDGDSIEIVIDRHTLNGTLNYVGPDDLGSRTPHPDLRPDPRLPDHTRLWAALQEVSGGTWGGAVYDVDAIVTRLKTGIREMKNNKA